MPRRRLGVVLLVPPPTADRVDGLRLAFGDPALDRVAPHITLVAPVNVREDDLPAALACLRAAAGQARPLDLTLGPVAVFPGDEHVAYLEVRGSDPAEAALADLQRRVSRRPLDRPPDHDFVPHVTLTQGIDPARLASVVAASGGWQAEPVHVDRLHLLEHQHAGGSRRWVPVADVVLAPRHVVGRGGLELELTPSQLVDPEALAEVVDAARPEADELPVGARPHVVTARREGRVVGLAAGWERGPDRGITGRWVDGAAAAHGVGEHLDRAFDQL